MSFDWRGIMAHDLAGRASAYRQLTQGGMSDADARAVVGL